MSHKRSGLLPGLIVGVLSALVSAALLGAAVLFQTRLPAAVIAFGNGHPLSLASSLVVALIVALAMGAVRPRSILLIPWPRCTRAAPWPRVRSPARRS